MPMLEDDIRALAKTNGIREVAFEDVLRQFPNDDTLSFREWFYSVKDSKAHWIEPKPTEAGDECHSIKAQADYVRKHGADATAAHLAKFGLTLGIVKKKPAASSGTSGHETDATTNPWSDKFKGSDEQRMKRRLSIIRMSTKTASEMARAQGRRIDGGPLLNQR